MSFGLSLGNGHWSDLLFCVLGVGVVEELLKIIPALVILRYTTLIDEAPDYVVYAGASAVGFSFAENLVYLSDSGRIDIVARSLSASVVHICLTAFVMYGLLDFVANGYRNRWISFARNLAIAAIVHGIYDFGILTGGFIGELSSLLSFAIAAWVVIVLARLIQNCLNNSNRFVGPSSRTLILANELIRGLGAVFLLQYFLVALAHGPSVANRDLLKQLFFCWFLLAVTLGALGYLKIEKGRVEELIEY